MSDLPVLLLDVDGVVNVFEASWDGLLVHTKVSRSPIRYAPALVHRLYALYRSATVEFRWATTWCFFEPELTALEDLLGITAPRAFTDRPPHLSWGDMKVDAAPAVLAEGRRLIWADDEEAAAARQLFPEIARAEREGRALLLTPVSKLGLQPEDLDAIDAFLTRTEVHP
jgi:hypothetical protein